jgi:hypothetical protein
VNFIFYDDRLTSMLSAALESENPCAHIIDYFDRRIMQFLRYPKLTERVRAHFALDFSDGAVELSGAQRCFALDLIADEVDENNRIYEDLLKEYVLQDKSGVEIIDAIRTNFAWSLLARNFFVLGEEAGSMDISDEDTEVLDREGGHFKFAMQAPEFKGRFIGRLVAILGPGHSIPNLYCTNELITTNSHLLWGAKFEDSGASDTAKTLAYGWYKTTQYIAHFEEEYSKTEAFRRTALLERDTCSQLNKALLSTYLQVILPSNGDVDDRTFWYRALMIDGLSSVFDSPDDFRKFEAISNVAVLTQDLRFFDECADLVGLDRAEAVAFMKKYEVLHHRQMFTLVDDGFSCWI